MGIITAENSRSTVFLMLYFTRMEQSYQNSSFGEASAPRQSITDGGYVSGRRYSEIDESTIQRPRIWPAFLAFILFPPVGFISFLLYKNAIDHIKYRRHGSSTWMDATIGPDDYILNFQIRRKGSIVSQKQISTKQNQ